MQIKILVSSMLLNPDLVIIHVNWGLGLLIVDVQVVTGCRTGDWISVQVFKISKVRQEKAPKMLSEFACWVRSDIIACL